MNAERDAYVLSARQHHYRRSTLPDGSEADADPGHAADLDESPMTYRRLEDVLAHHAASTRVLHRLRPFAVVMAGEGEFDPFKD